MNIKPDDLTSPDVLALVETHLTEMGANDNAVMANTLDLVLVRQSALQNSIARRKAEGVSFGQDGAADIRFGLDVLATGGHNLCTTAVRCGTLAPPHTVRDEMDSIGLSFLQPRRWDDILPSVTLLRELV